jgi:hypothetical protein
MPDHVRISCEPPVDLAADASKRMTAPKRFARDLEVDTAFAVIAPKARRGDA